MNDLPLIYGTQPTLGPIRLALDYRHVAPPRLPPVVDSRPWWRRWYDWLYNAALYWVYGH